MIESIDFPHRHTFKATMCPLPHLLPDPTGLFFRHVGVDVGTVLYAIVARCV